MNPHRLHAYILFLIVGIIWGIAGPVIKLTLNGLPPDVFLLYRFLLSSIVAILFFGKHIKFHSTSVFFKATLYSFLNVPFALLALFAGIDRTSLLHVSLITLMGPLLTILAGYIFLKDHVTKREKIGILIAFVGSLVILIEPILRAQNGGSLIGNALVFVYIASSAIAGVILKNLLREGVNAVTLANYSFLVGFITLLPIVLGKTEIQSVVTLVTNLNIWHHLGVFYMAFISGNLAFSLLNLGQKTVELSEAALFMYLQPIFSGLLAILILGDHVTTPVIIGSAITFVGVGIAEIKKRRYN